MPAPRPFGVGPYGEGPYSRYVGQVYVVGGATLLTFGAKAASPLRIQQREAASQILFDAWVERLDENWTLPAPCKPGTWAPLELTAS